MAYNQQRGAPANKQQNQQSRNQQNRRIPENEENTYSDRRPRRRDVERMNNWNQNKAVSWADKMDVEDRYEEATKRTTTNRPPGQNRPKKTTVASAPKDEPMYIGPLGSSIPVTTRYGQNLDFSGFIPMLKAFYNTCSSVNTNLNRELPYVEFQHAMVILLNLKMMEVLRTENSDGDFTEKSDLIGTYGDKMMVPKVVASYISGVCTTITPTGENVKFNLPQRARPKGPIAETVTKGACPSGSFGYLTSTNHNAYECYISPYITRRMIEHTLFVNRERNPDFGDWDPFPAGWLPENSRVTPDLLGYDRPQELHRDAVAELSKCAFTDSSTLAGRVAHCSHAVQRTSLILSRVPGVEMVPASFEQKETVATFCFKEYSGTPLAFTTPIGSQNSNIYGPYAMGPNITNEAHFKAYKRKRNIDNPGLSVYNVDQPFPGWLDHINDNFNMTGDFAPERQLSDKETIREKAHFVSVPEGDVSTDLTVYLRKMMKIKDSNEKQ